MSNDTRLPICERLRTMIIPPHKTWPTHHLNPDGPEAADTIDALVEAINDAIGEIEVGAPLTAQDILKAALGNLSGEANHVSSREGE